MVVINVKREFNISNITQDSSWDKVIKCLNDRLEADLKDRQNEEILLDMEDVYIRAPWRTGEINKILKMKNVKFKLYSCEDIVSGLKTQMILAGEDANRIEHVEVRKEKEVSSKELKEIEKAKGILPCFKLQGDTFVIDVTGVYNQFCGLSSVTSVARAIDMKHEETGVTKYVVHIGNLEVSDLSMERLVKVISDNKEKGIDIELSVNEENKEASELYQMNIFRSVNSGIDDERKMGLLSKYFHPGTPGMLMRYKITKGVDKYGRHGNGEAVECRIAVLNSIETKNGQTEFKFTTYNNDYFYTLVHWAEDYDGEQLEGLVVNNVTIPLNQIGFENLFFGSTYHFFRPLQRSIDEDTMVIHCNEDGEVKREMCTIPERMKIVFDDWGVSYDESQLNADIVEVRERLKNGA